LHEQGIFGDLIGMKLLLNPPGEPDPPDILDVARARPKSEPIQCLNDLEIRAEFALERIGRATGTRQDRRRERDSD
jgi:hypothetical protein